jgi:tetratricopeptide (TPR) repeat protein
LPAGAALGVQTHANSGAAARHSSNPPAAPTDATTRLLQQRLDAERAAVAGGNPVAVEKACRSLLALSLRQMGELRAAQGDWAEAVKLEQGSLTLEPSTETQIDLAEALLHSGNADAAKRELEPVIAAEPHNARALRLQEDLILHPEQPPQGPTLSAAQRSALEVRSGRLREALATGYNDWGTAAARLQQYQEAIGLLEQAEHWDPTIPGLMRNLGLAQFRVGNFAASARAFDMALASDPKDGKVRLLLGLSLFSAQRFAEAAKAFEPLGDAVLEDSHAGYAWAFSLAHSGEPQRANAILDKLSAKSLPADELAMVCQVYDQTENYEHAVTCFRKVYAEDPSIKQAHYQVGVALIHLDRPNDAIPELRQELKVGGETPETQFYLAYALLQTSQKDEAEALLKKVVAEQPDYAQAQYQLGKVELEQGQVKEAITHLELAAKAAPEDDYIHYQLQSAYRRDGRAADAERELAIYRDIKAKRREVEPAHTAESP